MVWELVTATSWTLLIRSLAEPAKSYVLHHSQGESYGAYRRSALKYEHQQRLFLELQGNKKMFSLQPEGISELNVSNPEVSEAPKCGWKHCWTQG